MASDEAAAAQRLGEASTTSPTLTLLGAYSRDWVLPLFAEHLEAVDDSVSAEWFHERVAEAAAGAREDREWQGERSPNARCAAWVARKWLETEMVDGRVRYRLSPYSLRALRFVREVAEGESSVSGARLGSIAHAVRRLADMTSPDRAAQLRRLDEEMSELQRRRDEIKAGRGVAASADQIREQVREVLAMIRTLPADFRQLRSMVEDRHRAIARSAMSDSPKAEMVEQYLHENDLLSKTDEGVAYRRFARMLSSSDEAASMQRDIDQVLNGRFAQEEMTAAQRRSLDTMFSTLLGAELQVQQAYVRWTSSLRRVLTRAAHGPQARLLSLTELALDAAAEWVEADPVSRGHELDADILRVGVLAIEDVSQTQLWRDQGNQTVSVTVTSDSAPLAASERAALRLAAGTSARVVGARVDDLVRERGVVTGSEVYEATPAEFQRLGTLVTLLDLAIEHGTVDTGAAEQVALAGDRERALLVLMPHLVFDRPLGAGITR